MNKTLKTIAALAILLPFAVLLLPFVLLAVLGAYLLKAIAWAGLQIMGDE